MRTWSVFFSSHFTTIATISFNKQQFQENKPYEEVLGAAQFTRLEIVKLRSRSQVRSRSGPRSGPKGPRAKDQRPGPGLTLNLVCHHQLTTTTSKLFSALVPESVCLWSKQNFSLFGQLMTTYDS